MKNKIWFGTQAIKVRKKDKMPRKNIKFQTTVVLTMSKVIAQVPEHKYKLGVVMWRMKLNGLELSKNDKMQKFVGWKSH